MKLEMTPERWERIEQLFHSAAEQTGEKRAAYLEAACAGDAELRREVESLLAHGKTADGWLGGEALKEMAEEVLDGASGVSLSGHKLGPYQVLEAIGAGGMGEVYRARDTRLNRLVAIKVLPKQVVQRKELRERLEREARTIASLNHAHICALYDVGHQDGVDYLVLEHLEGETLAERLKKGPLPLAKLLQYAIEIADALDKAHRKGITHRDLKPGNIMLTKSGTKLLDFGLAKIRQEANPASSESQRPRAERDMTAEGTILGTLQYMAPEQVEGKTNEIDARTDIFAFGVVVYEMATAKKAFQGNSQASLIAKILETDPAPISALQPMSPPALDRIVKKCLAKEPEKRWQDASDLCDQLKWIAEDSTPRSATSAAPAISSWMSRRWIVVAALACMVAALVVASALYLHRTPAVERQAVRFTVGPPENTHLNPNPMSLTVSPDGTKLVFIAADALGKQELWVRALDSSAAVPLSGTDNPAQPFWSADSSFVAFTASDGKLKKVAVSGGPTLTVADAGGGGTWSSKDVILFGSGLIYKVSAAGGAVTPVTVLDASRKEKSHWWPCFLPDGKHFLYLALTANPENNAIFVGSLDSKDTKLLLNVTSNVVYVPPGYLLFDRQGTLMAQPFDAAKLELTGNAVPLAEGLMFNAVQGRAAFAASQNGVLAYRGAAESAVLSLAWVTRNGTEQGLAAPPHNYTMPRISPDGLRVAAGIEESGSQVWIYDLSRDSLTRLTFEGNDNLDPVWSPDGKRITFKGNQQRLFWQPADGSGPAEELTKSDLAPNNIPGSFSPDGQVLTFVENPGYEVFTLPLADGKPRPFIRSPSSATAPRFSPDGRFISYASDESGRWEVYVRPYPGPGGKWQISTEGGSEPVWNPKGRELFYRSGNKMMAVDVTTEPAFSAGRPKMLFEGPYVPSPRTFPDYDVSPDGQRFLMLKPDMHGGTGEQINVVVNWTEELKQKVPAGQK